MENREIKFEILIRRKDGTDSYIEILTLDELLNRNGCLYNSNIQEIVYKRQFTGFKDNNKKEIFEGDYISNVHVTFEVYWNNDLGAFRCRREGSEKFIYELPINDKYWISGNIFNK